MRDDNGLTMLKRVWMRVLAACLTAVGFACAGSAAAASSAGPTQRPLLTVGYSSSLALSAATASSRAAVVRVFPRLHVAEVRPRVDDFARAARMQPGIRYVEGVQVRRPFVEPALFATTPSGVPYEWQYAATSADRVPASVLRAASNVTVAVIDTGADLTAPDIAAKSPHTFNIRLGGTDVRDVNGHGTFVSSLAAGSVTNGEGIAGFGGDAHLLVISASRDDGSMTDVDEANGIMYAVDHGARVINLSVGGITTSLTEQRAVEYATAHGVLLVAAVGNEFEEGNPVEYPAALLQPLGSNGHGGNGLSVGASSPDGMRAEFSNTGSQLSLLAPGDDVFSDISALADAGDYPRSVLPGSVAGSYGYASGTSFAAPEVAGAAALVMAANPFLKPSEVATILKETASGGSWTPQTGYGELDVAAAVARALGPGRIAIDAARSSGRVHLQWYSVDAAQYRLSLRIDKRRPTVLLSATTRTSTSVAVHRGHRYAFTVTGLDASGAKTGATTYTLKT